MKSYRVGEVFYSLQGEGMRAGTPSLFVRLHGCNLNCTKETAGFECDSRGPALFDTDAAALVELLDAMNERSCRWVVLTGGEPLLQVDADLCEALVRAGYHIAVETNGTIPLHPELSRYVHYIACSPKFGSSVKLAAADEVRFVLAKGMEPPGPIGFSATHRFVSPAAEGDYIPDSNLRWCVDFCLRNPGWRLSYQSHKVWGIP